MLLLSWKNRKLRDDLISLYLNETGFRIIMILYIFRAAFGQQKGTGCLR